MTLEGDGWWTCPKGCGREFVPADAFGARALWAHGVGARRFKMGDMEIEFFAPAEPPGPQFGDLSPEQLRMEADRRERAERDGKEADVYGASE